MSAPEVRWNSQLFGWRAAGAARNVVWAPSEMVWDRKIFDSVSLMAGASVLAVSLFICFMQHFIVCYGISYSLIYIYIFVMLDSRWITYGWPTCGVEKAALRWAVTSYSVRLWRSSSSCVHTSLTGLGSFVP